MFKFNAFGTNAVTSNFSGLTWLENINAFGSNAASELYATPSSVNKIQNINAFGINSFFRSSVYEANAVGRDAGLNNVGVHQKFSSCSKCPWK